MGLQGRLDVRRLPTREDCAATEAYAAGTIQLPQPPKNTDTKRVRYAPHFNPGSSHDPCDLPYTAETIQSLCSTVER